MPYLPFETWQQELLQVMRQEYPELFGESSPAGKIERTEIDWMVYQTYHGKGFSPREAVERAIMDAPPLAKKSARGTLR
jgi:hypothetical protein